MGEVLMAVCVGLLLVFSGDCMAAAQTGATVFVTGVMPALFPMMVLAGLPLGRQGGGTRSASVFAVAFGFASGSPAGARKVRALRDGGRISQRRTAALFAAVGVMSPMFFLGTLALWTRNGPAAAAMLLSHWLAALCVGLAVEKLPWGRRANREGASDGPVLGDSALLPRPSLLAALPEAVASAARSLLSVCGAMMLFSILAALLKALLGVCAPAFVQNHGTLWAIVHALLEIGGGAHAVLGAQPYDSPHTFALLAGLCSFGGLSIWMQNLAFVGQSIRPATLLFLRAAHGALAYGVCRLLLLCWPQAVKAVSLMVPPPLPASGSSPLPALAGLLALGLLSALWQKSKTCSPHS